MLREVNIVEIRTIAMAEYKRGKKYIDKYLVHGQGCLMILFKNNFIT